MIDINAISAIAYRDLIKFLRDPLRIVSTLIFPIVFIGVLGGSFQASWGDSFGYDFLTFTFTGVFAQTLFQSSALGLVSLIEDRENDFSQEMFVSPISRYAIIFGKILGETLVALAQGIAVIVFGLLVGISMTWSQLLGLLPVAFVACLFGGAFGVIIMANISSQRAANQIFPFVILPQFFLAGVFNSIKELPVYLDVLSLISPMRYPVDLTRGVFYLGLPEYEAVVVASPVVNLLIMGVFFMIFLMIGTLIFVRNERNR
ncbi:MAG: ABC transporter permease [Anaerolineae bacterium]|nr:ABC transporter permease [Anaerolineae bacterium]